MFLRINDQLQALDLEDALNRVSEQRKLQTMQYRREKDQRQSVACYLLLQQILHEEYHIEDLPLFDYEGNGKPFLVNHPEIHFNMSHADSVVICGVDTHPIGVDVEMLQNYSPDIVAYTMNEEESKCIATAPDPAIEFCRLWTMKESYLKFTGEGLRDDLKSVLTDLTPSISFHTTLEERKGYIYTICQKQ